METSWSHNPSKPAALDWIELVPVLPVIEETEGAFHSRVSKGQMERVRVLEPASASLHVSAAESGVHVIDVPVLANGRLELLHFLREVAISIDYHRYGNLGMREGELRKPIL
jgi:RHH-type proline utilization regulon transcriptional repressor/proline dehydrogenase/delta 1-pyrroline-5-carboxylate dehydrogenase